MADGRIVIDTSLDNSGIQKGISGLSGVVNKGMSSVVKSVGAASVAFAAAGGFAIKTGVDFESGMSEVSAISGATADEITQLTEKAKEMVPKQNFRHQKVRKLLNIWLWPDGKQVICLTASKAS